MMQNYLYSPNAVVRKLSRDEINSLREKIQQLSNTLITDVVNIRCPLCGDSVRDSSKKRGYFGFHDGTWKYQCYHAYGDISCGMYSMEDFIRGVRQLHSDFDSIQWGDQIDMFKYEHILKWNSLLKQDFTKHG